MDSQSHRAKYVDKLVVVLIVVYLVTTSAYMIAHGQWFSYDQFFLAALLATILLRRTRQFLRDWLPFLALLFCYDSLRGLVPTMIKTVHITPMIRADQAIFGFIPAVRLQALLYDPASLHWYDFVAVLLYLCHFVVPMLVGFTFWLNDRRLFRDFALGILILSYACFVTFIIFPAMPPWMAGSQGYLPPIQDVMGAVMSKLLPPLHFPTLFALVDSDPVAAMPSLHAAYPFLVFLFICRKVGRRGLVLLTYVLGVWFAVMYLGEHYFADVLVGTAYAVIVYLLVTRKERIGRSVTRFISSLRARRKQASPIQEEQQQAGPLPDPASTPDIRP